MTEKEKIEFVEMVAQAVLDKIDEREQINRLADTVVERVLALQREERILHDAGVAITGSATNGNGAHSQRIVVENKA